MSGLVERCARKCREALEARDSILETLTNEEIDDAVRAVLRASLPPTEAMIEAGVDEYFSTMRGTDLLNVRVVRILHAMLNAELDQKEGE